MCSHNTTKAAFTPDDPFDPTILISLEEIGITRVVWDGEDRRQISNEDRAQTIQGSPFSGNLPTRPGTVACGVDFCGGVWGPTEHERMVSAVCGHNVDAVHFSVPGFVDSLKSIGPSHGDRQSEQPIGILRVDRS